MNENFDAFDISPVPRPGPDAVAPTLYRGIYGMPCLLDQIAPLLSSLRALDAAPEVRDTSWNTRDVEVVTPENARVLFTAAKVFDPTTLEGQNLQSVGIGRDDNGSHG